MLSAGGRFATGRSLARLGKLHYNPLLGLLNKDLTADGCGSGCK